MFQANVTKSDKRYPNEKINTPVHLQKMRRLRLFLQENLLHTK